MHLSNELIYFYPNKYIIFLFKLFEMALLFFTSLLCAEVTMESWPLKACLIF